MIGGSLVLSGLITVTLWASIALLIARLARSVTAASRHLVLPAVCALALLLRWKSS